MVWYNTYCQVVHTLAVGVLCGKNEGGYVPVRVTSFTTKPYKAMQATVTWNQSDAENEALRTQNNVNKLLTEPMGLIKVGPGLDLKRYAYCAAPVTGQCLSTRPGGPVFDGDTIVFRELSGWSDSWNPGILLPYVGRLVGVVTNRGFMLKELECVDFYHRRMVLKQYTPLRRRMFLFGEVLALYAVDEVQRGVEFV